MHLCLQLIFPCANVFLLLRPSSNKRNNLIQQPIAMRVHQRLEQKHYVFKSSNVFCLAEVLASEWGRQRQPFILFICAVIFTGAGQALFPSQANKKLTFENLFLAATTFSLNLRVQWRRLSRFPRQSVANPRANTILFCENLVIVVVLAWKSQQVPNNLLKGEMFHITLVNLQWNDH